MGLHWWLVPLCVPVCAQAAPVEAFLELPTARLHYLEWKTAGTPLVLVPGGCQTAHVFGDFAPLLTGRFRVIAVTPRGCGSYGPPQDGYGIDRHIDDLVRLLDAMGIRKAIFAGHSSGGGVVVRLANRFPARVRGIVTFDILYDGVPDEFEEKLDQAIAAKAGRAGGVSLEAHRANFKAWELGTWSDGLEREFREQTERQSDGGLRYRRRPEWQAAFAADMKRRLYFDTRMRHPALFLVARDLDVNRIRQFPTATRRNLLPMAKAIGAARARQMQAIQSNGGNVRVRWMKNASHYLFVDRAQAVVKEMVRFAGSLEAE